MTDNIKLPPLPPLHIVPSVEPVDYPEVAQALMDYAREAVRLNATVPDAREIFNAGWCAAARFCDREDVVYDGLVGPGGCPAFEEAYRAALSAAQEAPAHPNPPPVCQGTNCGATDGENHSPECILEAAEVQGWSDSPEAEAARRAIASQAQAAQAVPEGWKLVPADVRVNTARGLLEQMLDKDLKRYGLQTARAEGAQVNVQEIEAAMNDKTALDLLNSENARLTKLVLAYRGQRNYRHLAEKISDMMTYAGCPLTEYQQAVLSAGLRALLDTRNDDLEELRKD